MEQTFIPEKAQDELAGARGTVVAPPLPKNSVLDPAVSAEIEGLPAASERKKPRRNLFIPIVAIVSLCMCIGIAGSLLGAGLWTVRSEWPYVESTIDEFMIAMVEKDTDRAYDLFSHRSKKSTRISDLEKLLEGNNFALFAGYQSATITNLTINAKIDTNPDMPQGRVAEAYGTVTYDHGFAGDFNAVLEMEDDEWKIFSIFITVPPDKFTDKVKNQG